MSAGAAEAHPKAAHATVGHAGGHHEHHAHHGDAASDEPKTPMWLTALGGLLFLIAGLVWGLSSTASEIGDTAPPTTEAAPARGAPAGH